MGIFTGDTTKGSIKSHVKCLENIFKVDENIGHEITQIYLVEFIDSNLYELNHFNVTEGKEITCAKWIPVADFELGKRRRELF